MKYPPHDLHAMARSVGIDLAAALDGLFALYAEVDARNAVNTRGLDLPCHRGCDMCCHESVFLTPLEFFAAWDWAQKNLDQTTRDGIVDAGLALYAKHRGVIEALDTPPPQGARDHLELVRGLRYRCPVLGDNGECRVYPARELYARLFGSSFNAQGGVYGCHLVGAHLADKLVTLLSAPTTARELGRLPLTDKRQVYPYYFNMLYGTQT